MISTGDNMELIQIGGKTFYIKNPTNIGIYKIDDENVYLIDSGNDQDAGKKILKLIEEQKWQVKGIISTHSNADHIGGNQIIQKRTNCKILAHGIEKSFTEFPILESSFLWGGYPHKDLQNKFLLAKESIVEDIKENLPIGLDYISLKGHFLDMIGIKTSDSVYFLADALFSEETISKYHVFFIYDVKSFLDTLDFLETLDGKFYIPSHCNVTTDIHPLIELNRKKVQEIAEVIYNSCRNGKIFEEILKSILDYYDLRINANQYVLVGSTVKSFLSYLYEENKLIYEFQNNTMIWKWKK